MAIVAAYKAYYKIGEVSKILGLEPHVIRYWESQFTDIRPEISGSNRKMYTRSDLEMFAVIFHLIRTVQCTIEGARQRIQALKKSGELPALKAELVEYSGRPKTVGSLASLGALLNRTHPRICRIMLQLRTIR